MDVTHWLDTLKGRFFRAARLQPRRQELRRRAVASVTPQAEALEDRTLLAVNSAFFPLDQALIVEATADDSIAITVNGGGNVLVNGQVPSTGPLPASSVRAIRVLGSSGRNNINLAGVTTARFTSLTEVTVDGGQGADTITGSPFNDSLVGGHGDDILLGGDGADTIRAGDGNDLVNALPATVVTVVGADTITTRTLTPTLGNGADCILGGDGNDTILGGDGNDNIDTGDGEDLINGSFDTMSSSAGTVTVMLLPINDPGDDTLSGGDGADSIFGGTGNDLINAGFGNDLADGSEDADTLFGGSGSDTLLGGTGDDRLNGQGENDELHGNDGNDTLVGGSHNDLLFGEDGDDSVEGDAATLNVLWHGNDTIDGGAGADTIEGQGGQDSINGGTGDDSLFGGIGNDIVSGDADNDHVFGNAGADTVIGGGGADFVDGGTGNDLILSAVRQFFLDINDVVVIEGSNGSQTAVFTVTLSEISLTPVTVNFSTSNGTAQAMSDYVPTSGTLTFQPGVLQQTISVPIVGDTLIESDEMFFVDLSNASGAIIRTGRGRATIIDDDTPPSISISDAAVLEPDPPLGSMLSFLPATTLTLPQFASPSDVIAVDIDGDGDLDLVSANSNRIGGNSISIFRSNGDGTFAAPMQFGAGDGPSSVAAGDFDGDGDADLAVANAFSDNVTILLNTGTGGAFTTATVAVGDQPRDITSADVDGDGDLDLLTANENSDNVTVLVNSGAGVFTPGIAGNTADAPWAIIARNFNAGTDPDLAVAAGNFAFNSNLSVLLGAAMTTFTGPTNFPLAAAPRSIDAADFDGDGNLDVVIGGQGNFVSVMFGNGAGAFSPPNNVSVGIPNVQARGVVAADLDNDGDVDIAATIVGTGGNFVVVFTNDGSATFTNAGMFAVGADPFAIAAGDFNGDGLIDLATANNAFDEDTISVLLNATGTTAVTAAVVVTLSRPATTTITVDFASADGTATAGLDYSPVAGTLTFMPGQTVQVINVAVFGDDNIEPNETFTINLSNPVGATIADPQATVTIFDDDAGTVLFVGDVFVLEGTSGMTDAVFPVQLSQPAAVPISVDFATANGTATAGEDYVAMSGTLTIPAGMTMGMITVPVIGDDRFEGNETFFLNLSNLTMPAILARPQATATIVEDPAGMPMMPPMPMVPTGVQTFTIDFDELPTQPVDDLSFMGVTFDFKVSGLDSLDANFNVNAAGTLMFLQDPVLEGNGNGILTLDFANPASMLQFGVARAIMTALTPGLTVELFDENLNSLGVTAVNLTPLVNFAEAQFTYAGTPVRRAVLNFAAAGSPSRFAIDNLTFQVDLGPGIMIDSPVVPLEGDTGTTTVTLTVTLDQPSTEIVTVDFATEDGTATAGADYIAAAGTLTFLPGETVQTITITILGDDLDEPAETFFVNLSNVSRGVLVVMQGVVTILNDDPALDPVGDTLLGDLGNDTIIGGDGNDSINGQADDDVIEGMGGNDTIFGGAGRDLIQGGDGNDSLDGGRGTDSVFGDAGNDTIAWDSGDGTERVVGGLGFDVWLVRTGPENDRIWVDENNTELRVIHRIPSLPPILDTLHGDEIEELRLLTGAGNDRVIVGDLRRVTDVQLITVNLAGGADLVDASAQSNLLIRMSVLGGSGADTIIGGAGHDTLSGEAGNDSISGGEGNDVLDGGLGVDKLDGGGGNDRIDGGDGRDFIRGGMGNDTLLGGAKNDDIYGGGGNDLIDGGEGNDFVLGEDGNDSITGAAGADTLSGGRGADTVHGDTPGVVTGREGADSILGGDGPDVLFGGLGSDRIFGGEGDDTLAGGDGIFVNFRTQPDGDDFLNGNGGHDSLMGEEGNDTLLGGAGNDTLRGGVDNDSINGNGGADSLLGGDGDDFLRGGEGEDRMNGGHGRDTLWGEAGNDGLSGHDGNDVLNGGGGADTLHGGDGHDTLRGGAGQDILIGHDGSDDLDGQGGSYDTLVGGDSFDILNDNGGTDIIDNRFRFFAEWIDAV